VKTDVNSGGVYPQPSDKKRGFQWDGKLVATLVVTLANLTLIILFSEMLKFVKNYFFQIKNKF
jgi:hypothetical protein